jgi:amino acid transporter
MDQPTPLLRSLSLLEISFYGIGTIVGAGIYVLLGKVVSESGMMAPWAFLLAAVVVCFSAASYAELSRRFPHSAGEPVYIVESLRSRHLGALVGYVLVLGAIISAATITRGFTGYMGVFSHLPDWSMMTILIITPIPATLLAGSLVLAFAIWLPVTTLARATSCLILLVFTFVNLSLLSLHYRERQRGPLQLGLPATGTLLCIGFLVIQIWSWS